MPSYSSPQTLPSAPDSYERQNEQETRDMIGRSLDQLVLDLQTIEKTIEGTIGDLSYLVPENNLNDVVDAGAARTNLGLEIGADIQAHSDVLDDVAGLTPAADRLPYFDSATTATLATLTSAGRSMIGAADVAAQTALLDVFTTALKGLVPSGGSSGTFLRGDATFQDVVTSISIQVISASGTYTPTAGMKFVLIILIGAGAGGGGADSTDGGSGMGGAGGGAGATCIALMSAATIGSSQSVTIGTKGTGGSASGGIGTAGGNSTLGSLLEAAGGAPGNGAAGSGATSRSVPGAGGLATGGDLNVAGGSGDYGGGVSSGYSRGGRGGGSLFGDGGYGAVAGDSQKTAGGDGAGYGSGGGGAADTNTSGSGDGVVGGDGADGVMFALEFI